MIWRIGNRLKLWLVELELLVVTTVMSKQIWEQCNHQLDLAILFCEVRLQRRIFHSWGGPEEIGAGLQVNVLDNSLVDSVPLEGILNQPRRRRQIANSGSNNVWRDNPPCNDGATIHDEIAEGRDHMGNLIGALGNIAQSMAEPVSVPQSPAFLMLAIPLLISSHSIKLWLLFHRVRELLSTKRHRERQQSNYVFSPRIAQSIWRSKWFESRTQRESWTHWQSQWGQLPSGVRMHNHRLVGLHYCIISLIITNTGSIEQ